MTLLSPGDFWVASGHHLCDLDAEGRLRATPDLWRAFLARPELVPPEEACDAERALHARLMESPLAVVDPAGLADPDAGENWQVFLNFRDKVAAEPTLEAAWLKLFRGNVGGIPPLFLQMLTHLVARAAMEGEGDAFTLRAAECLFRTQRAAITQGATLLADEEVVDARHADGDLGALGRLLTEAGAPPREVELDVLSEENAPGYKARSDAHDMALDIAESRQGQFGLARALERFTRHMFGETVRIKPVPVIEDRNWTWHVGLDAEATRIANALWDGKKVKQADLARILWLGVLEFEDPTRVVKRAQGRPVYLALAMDAAQRVRMKPQNLVSGLPLVEAEKAA
ncbi:DUF6352 family protein [Sediminicoccus rosea]|jgi:hypothetical protein|uniref:DUF6352 family protein n=1 Tax=Sediminicoccus rosea TaxID=1225128 RepID=A0ABZ0PIT4_9PROT|nr:DUF6352 family protein [Sediminicoccus rosea]WPB85569.1 DUF6352 family protein [Sediminicoccus rosea]